MLLPGSALPCPRQPLPGWLVLLVACLLPFCASAKDLTYEADIRPLLKKHCFHCHGEGEKLKGGLDLRLRRFMVQPNAEGDVAVRPGHPEQSELVLLVREGEMPKKAKPLAAPETALLAEWVAQGAKTARPEPETVPKVWITEEERAFWSFQPLAHPPVPAVQHPAQVRTPVDAFLLAKLEPHGLTFAPPADPTTLLRRLSFDLTGLPPSPDELATFLADPSPTAYEHQVERLLASPRYGERWARHWLDVAGYADSDGYSEKDPIRPWAFKYRDYVIRAFNADKPFDQFIREQLAGDELVPQPFTNLSAESQEKLTATGFLRTVPDGTADATDQPTARNAVVVETLKVVGSSLLGITVGCAQCHDHKLDPVPQLDYYRLRAIFEPGLSPARWKAPAARLLSLQTDAQRAESLKIEAEAKLIDTARTAKEANFITEVLEEELAQQPEPDREPLRAAYRAPLKARTPAQEALLKAHPTVMKLSASSLYLYDQKTGKKRSEELKTLTAQATAIRARKPAPDFLAPFTEPASVAPPPTHLFIRGDTSQPGESLTPGTPTVLGATAIPERDPKLPTTGRRLAFAQTLTTGEHPLVSRVLVNRVWSHHFGRGLVSTLGDFGTAGTSPTHPELLDWLAREWVRQGWSMKALHRLMVCSTAYRQSSARDAATQLADSENHLLSRMPVHRLEAEELRDAMLTASGKLNPKMFGPPIPVMPDESGQIILGIDNRDGAGRPVGKLQPLNGEEFRRSLYITQRRTTPLGMLETFDLPRMEPNCEARTASTVAPQSLALMNGDFPLAQAKFLAERAVREAGPQLPAQLHRAWLLALSRQPTLDELAGALAFTREMQAHFTAHPAPKAVVLPGQEPPPIGAEALALTIVCQALFATNGFLYVD